ncbi:MAG: ABC transporter substrate-binding protein [Eubacteriales bacterium]|nr:ABC transporter substrate-binding protein [Eubacteriales bacterium]
MKKSIKRVLSLFLICILLLQCVACNKATVSNESTKNVENEETQNIISNTRIFVDSLGREITLPINIDRVAITGPLAQIVCFPICADKLVGIANEWDKNAKEYFQEKYYNLPLLGQLYGGKGELNLETLLKYAPNVIIDVGESKKGMTEDLDKLQNQIGIPFVHIDATLAKMDETYTILGELLNMKEEAKVLSDYCKETYDRALNLSNTVEKKNVLYCLGQTGLNVIAENSYFSEVFDLLCNNVAKIDNPSSKGSGNEIDAEQLLKWNPDYIFFAPDSIYDTVEDNVIWDSINAIKNKNYYKVPASPYNIFGFPPSVQRMLGLTWCMYTLYPENCDFDIRDEFKKFYQMFYHANLTDEMLDKILYK